MNKILLVFIGGGTGSLVRYSIGTWIGKMAKAGFPWGTFTINILASFVLGLLAGFMLLRPGQLENQRLLIGVGFCGGFSTFSTFTLELFDMLRDGNYGSAFIYAIGSVVACLLAFWIADLLLRQG